jgi:arylsulfatase A
LRGYESEPHQYGLIDMTTVFQKGTTFLLLGATLLLASACNRAPEATRPNFVIIFADDLGYGDLGSYGHPTIRTPNLDRLASEGMKLTQFYAAASVCTPSRAGLMTGRYPVRTGMAGDRNRVLFPNSENGIPDDEITIAEALKEQGYATAAIGKWHLGHHEEFLPTQNGFDYYYGIPYSNDMDPVRDESRENMFEHPVYDSWNVPLMRNNEIIERPADQRTITRRYTEQAIQFIHEQKDGPFFVYLAHNLPHVPLFRSAAFENVSQRGLYGDVVEEIDWSVGAIARALQEEGLAENTLLVFTSDNGPWLVYDAHGGSAGLLRGGKGMTWEGGMREPAIAWWPGTVRPGSVSEAITTTMDFFPTAMQMAGAELPADRVIDGQSLLPLLRGEPDATGHESFLFFRGTQLYAVRNGAWKAHFITEWAYRKDTERTEHEIPLLFNLEIDPSEKYDVAEDHPDIVAQMRQLYADATEQVGVRPTLLDARTRNE